MRLPFSSSSPSQSLSIRAICGGLASFACLALVGAAGAAERYTLQTADDPPVRSVAVFEGNTLTITDSAGKSFVYLRAASFDTPDGELLGYFSRAANVSLRWPANGGTKFLIGDPNGRNFRESRMSILPAADGVDPPRNVPLPRVGGKPAVPPPPPVPRGQPAPRGVGPVVGRGADGFRRARTLAELALLPGAGDTLTAAYIDPAGQLQFFQGWNDTWRRRQVPLRAQLVPGAPLALQATVDGVVPNMFTVGARGELQLITGGERSRRLTDRATFVPGAHLVVGGTVDRPSLLAVDQRGSIWDVGLADGQTVPVEENAERYASGAPLSYVAAGGEQELFVIDRQGSLANYRNATGRWEGPDLIARGFSPGGRTAATISVDLDGQPQLLVAAVDALGQLQVFRATRAGWVRFPLGQVALPPGAPVAIGQADDGIHVSAITRDGTWVEWFQERGRGLIPREIGRGFPPGGSVAIYPHEDHLHAVAFDSAGRLVAASLERGVWSSVLLVPEFDLMPRLVRREVIQGDPLPPATVTLENRHNEEVIANLIDELSPSTPRELRIGPGQASQQQLKRDPGAVLEETWLIPDADGNWTEDIRRTNLPAPPRYRVVLYANRTTYTYVDKRKKPGPVKDFDVQTPVSLGTFRLPPGAELQDGDTFDVYREAVIRNNPGAAALVDPLRP